MVNGYCYVKYYLYFFKRRIEIYTHTTNAYFAELNVMFSHAKMTSIKNTYIFFFAVAVANGDDAVATVAFMLYANSLLQRV